MNIICGDRVVNGLVVEPVWLRIPAYRNGCYVQHLSDSQLKELVSSCDDYSTDSLKAIFLGKSTFVSLSEQELSDIQYWLQDLSSDIPNCLSIIFSHLQT